jgi:hypothetical protein
VGYEEQCVTIQELYQQGRQLEAEALVTLEMVGDVALVGPRWKIRDDLQLWEASCVTTMLVSGPPTVQRLMAEL